MSKDRTSAGDPARTLRLLWRGAWAPPQAGAGPGRPRALSVDAVVSAAVALADSEGLDALTMRRLAEQLGVRPMTLYTYVPGRAELLDLMLDSLYASMPRHRYLELSWQDRVRGVAEANRSMFCQHPWAAAVSTLRPPLGPGQMAKYEYELAAFTGSGLGDLEIDDALTHVLTFVCANARAAAIARHTHLEEGADDQEWWDSVQALLAEVLDPHTYPLASRIGSAAGTARGSAHEPQHAYVFGLARIIESFELLTQRDLE